MNQCEICGAPCMSSPCRGCKRAGRVGSNEVEARARLEAGGPLAPLEAMSEAEVLEQAATWMALKNGGTKEQVLETLAVLPAAHVRMMLEQLRGGA